MPISQIYRKRGSCTRVERIVIMDSLTIWRTQLRAQKHSTGEADANVDADDYYDGAGIKGDNEMKQVNCRFLFTRH